MRVILSVLALCLLLPQIGIAADLGSLTSLFQENFNGFYQPRFCGRNIERFVVAAQESGIDLDGSYVLNIRGAGFLETSAFYSRGAVNERSNLGTFHVVFVAEGHVFDFDLHEPLVLPLEDYVRLQFTPPVIPYRILGMRYDPMQELPWWTVTRYEWNDYLDRGATGTWTKQMDEILNIEEIVRRPRIR